MNYREMLLVCFGADLVTAINLAVDGQVAATGFVAALTAAIVLMVRNMKKESVQ